MTNAYIGEIRAFGFNFFPRSWLYCDGRLLSISQNTALFSLLGVQYGGNGTSTFGLPDLRGRVSVGTGNGPGLTPYTVGQIGGIENETILTTEMPAHSHAPYSRTKPGTANGHRVPVAGDYLTRLNVTSTAPGLIWHTAPNTNATTLAPQAVGVAGGSQPHTNIQPILVLNYCICVAGIYPTRN